MSSLPDFSRPLGHYPPHSRSTSFRSSTNDDEKVPSPHIRIEESPIHGRGVFANMFIPSGSYIGEYTGPEAKRNGKYVLHLDGKPAVRGTALYAI